MTEEQKAKWTAASKIVWPFFWLMLFVSVVAGCQKEFKPAPPATFVITGCQYFPRLTASKRDTDETKEEILAYLTAYDKVCPKKP